MSSVLIVLSFVVPIAFFAVLLSFQESLTRLLRSAAEALESAASVAGGIRQHCAVITPAIDQMNQNLYVVGANLLEVGSLSEELSTE